MDKRTKLIKRASYISIVGNALLAGLKITLGLMAGSLSVVGDGIDSSTDVVISFISLLAARIMSMPSDQEHPYGHTRAETMATTLLAFVIFFAGAQLLLSTIQSLASGAVRSLPQSFAIYVTLASIAGKLLLAYSQFLLGKKTGSALLIANGKNMRNDVLISTTVLCGLFFTFILKMPILDSIMALLVSIWIIKTAIGIFLETNTELMDGIKDHSLYLDIFEAVKTVKGAGNPHRTRIRKLANLYNVDLDIEVDGTLSVTAAHNIAIEVERAIKNKIENIYDVMVHVEPEGNWEHGEQFGLTEASISQKKDE